MYMPPHCPRAARAARSHARLRAALAHASFRVSVDRAFLARSDPMLQLGSGSGELQNCGTVGGYLGSTVHGSSNIPAIISFRWPTLGRNRAQHRRNRANFGQSRAKFGRAWLNPLQVRWKRKKVVCNIWPAFTAKNCPESENTVSTKVGQDSKCAQSSQSWPDVERCCTTSRPSSAKFRPKSTRHGPRLTRVGMISANFELFTKERKLSNAACMLRNVKRAEIEAILGSDPT